MWLPLRLQNRYTWVKQAKYIHCLSSKVSITLIDKGFRLLLHRILAQEQLLRIGRVDLYRKINLPHPYQRIAQLGDQDVRRLEIFVKHIERLSPKISFQSCFRYPNGLLFIMIEICLSYFGNGIACLRIVKEAIGILLPYTFYIFIRLFGIFFYNTPPPPIPKLQKAP